MPGFIKVGELQVISEKDIQNYESVFSDPLIEKRFKKFANELKRITPKSNDFLYFSAIFMHAAEASLINPDGSLKKSKNGEPIQAYWDKKGESLKWVCNDPSISPYANSNGDIFPEEELLKAHKLFIGRPLCVDHKSSSVDAVRGVILDTYYDRAHKRIVGLCALDKVSFPELAHGITSGYKTSVSMGTAVGRAICLNCGQVAKTERDFCSHMRAKTGGGEINAELSPIELSIVVTPADSQAKIRTIIAAAQTVNDHLADQEKELNILFNSTNLETDQLYRLEQLEKDVKQANDKLAELTYIIDTDKSEVSAPYGVSSGRYEDPVDETDVSFGLNLPEHVANDTLLNVVKDLKASLETRLCNMEKSLNKLHKNKEEIMSKDAMNKQSYFQGGGGVNEPTPGQKKYPVDPKNEEMRMKDKHMVGEPPFPEVGAVDGLHPSPSSADQKDELERKKMLARAEQEDRSMRRAAALQRAKEAYWQGGGGVNEPEPHKQKYPVDNLQYELRENKDKQMVGQKPFPGVGDVEGLHPSPESAEQSDELARKKLLQRASLKAKFVRVANTDGTDNLGESVWQVYAKDDSGEKLVFTASVNEISGGKSDALFEVIANKDFGYKMLGKIRNIGLDKAASLYKKSQAVAGPGATPGPAADVGGAGEVPAMPEMGAPSSEPVPQDEGGKGDPKETALKLAEKVRDLSSDLLEAVRTLTGEQSQMGEMEDGLEAMPKAASAQLAPLYKMRKDLHNAILSGAKKSLAELREHTEELELIATTVNTDSSVNKEYLNSIIEDAFEDAKKAVANGFGIMKGYSKYAHGTAGLVKRAQEVEQKMLSLASEELNPSDENDMSYANDMSSEHEDEACAHDHNLHMGEDDEMLLPHDENEEHEEHEGHFEDEGLGLEDLSHELPSEDMPADDMNDTMVELPPGTPVPQGAKAVAAKKFDLTTKEGRSAYRAKLAADATGKEESGEIMDASKMPHSDMLDEANKLADGQTELDVKPADQLGLIETQPEKQKKDLEVAKAEPKVREAAERLNQLISQGKVKVAELDSLIAQSLDPEVVKYWKQYYGQAGKEGGEFGKLLTTEMLKSQAAEEMKNYKVKIARAFELTNDMVRRGLLADDRVAINAQVEEVMKWNDDAFESMKRVIAKQTPLSMKKEAMPQVGLIGSGDSFSKNVELDFQSELDKAFSGRKY